MAISTTLSIKQINVGLYLRKPNGNPTDILLKYKWIAQFSQVGDASGGSIEGHADLGDRDSKGYYVVTQIYYYSNSDSNTIGIKFDTENWEKFFDVTSITIGALGSSSNGFIIAGRDQGILNFGRPRQQGTNPGRMTVWADNQDGYTINALIEGYTLSKPIPILSDMPEVK